MHLRHLQHDVPISALLTPVVALHSSLNMQIKSRQFSNVNSNLINILTCAKNVTKHHNASKGNYSKNSVTRRPNGIPLANLQPAHTSIFSWSNDLSNKLLPLLKIRLFPARETLSNFNNKNEPFNFHRSKRLTTKGGRKVTEHFALQIGIKDMHA